MSTGFLSQTVSRMLLRSDVNVHSIAMFYVNVTE